MVRVWILRVATLLVFFPLLGTIVGCSSKRAVPISGTLVLPAGVKVVDNDTINVGFVAQQQGDEGSAASASPTDLTFKAKQTVPGKYKVTVSITPYPGEKNSEARAAQFEALNKKYAPASTPLNYEVTSDPDQSITIDLGAGTVTKSK